MILLRRALSDMRRQLLRIPETETGLRQLSVPLLQTPNNDPLRWLSAQAFYPQFYWQSRDGDEQVAALGAVKNFTALTDAQDFCQAHSPYVDLRVYGLHAFSGRHSALFLPLLEWRETSGQGTLILTLGGDAPRQTELREAQAFIDGLCLALTPLLQPTDPCHIVHCPDEKGWHTLVGQALENIAAGHFEKVVLARATDLTFANPVDPGAMLAASRAVNYHCYHYFLALTRDDAFLGSSPERLWQRTGRYLKTEALAGTVPNDTDPVQAAAAAEWLRQDDKNQRENTLVVDDIVQRLQPDVVALDVSACEVVSLRNVQHLRRALQGTLRIIDDARSILSLQPTAAVAGLPREAARQFITRHEPFDREWYAGSAGYLSCRHSEFCVALRAAKVSQRTVRLYAGAGIVAGSLAESEWQEITHKAAGLRSLLTEK